MSNINVSIEKFFELDPLYCLDKNNNIREFKAIANKHKDSIFCSIQTMTARIDGKNVLRNSRLVKSGKNIGKKNETSIWEQTIKEATSLWEEKLNEGYKSKQMIIDKFNLEVKNVKEASIEYLFMLANIQYNTTKDWNELPMLANRYKNQRKQIEQERLILAQPKLNGVRCLAKVNKDGDVILMSRGGQYYTVEHIQKQLKILLADVARKIDALIKVSSIENVVFDGEIYKHNTPLQLISGAVRKEEQGLFKSDNWLEYHIYDVAIPVFKQIDRLKILTMISNSVDMNNYPAIKTVYTTDIKTTHESIKHAHDKCIQSGYEGLMLRKIRGQYSFSFRSNDLIKVKEFNDADFIIIGCKVDTNKTVEDSFVFCLKNDINESTFYARPTGTAAMKSYWFNHRDSWEGKKATVRFQERSTDGLPIQAHVRSEKSDCLVIENIRKDGE